MVRARISDMVRPCIGAGRDSSACRLVGRSHSPCRSIKATLFALSSVQAGAVVLEYCSPQLLNTSGYESLFNAVLWACGSFVESVKFASCLNRQSRTRSFAAHGERIERHEMRPDLSRFVSRLARFFEGVGGTM